LKEATAIAVAFFVFAVVGFPCAERCKILAMNSAFLRRWASVAVASGLVASLPAFAQDTVKHGRKYTPPPATAHIVVTVVKKFNDKPMDTIAVMFKATKNNHETGNMEIRTNSQGQAIMDLIEAGSHVRLQVFALGYATHAEEFDVDENEKDVLVKLERPKAQVSGYTDDGDKPAATKPGTQEHIVQKPAPAPTTTTTTSPQQ
jgi:hypothetical protein